MERGGMERVGMKRAILYVVLALLMAWPLSVRAEERPSKVVVFPFDIFSRQPLGHLRYGLQKMLGSKLAEQGVVVVPAEEVNQALEQAGKPLDLSLARRLAGKLGADFGVYGSLTKIGSRISLDVKVLDALGMTRTQSVFVEGTGLDMVPALTARLATELAVRVSGREKVAQVIIKGNKRIETEAIRAVIKTKPGTPYSPVRLDKDLRAVWKLGYFDDVRMKTTDSPKGKVVTFTVKEKPMLREVHISGNKAFDTKDLRDQIGIKPFGVFRPASIKEAEAKIVKLYHDKGYYDVKVTSKVEDLPSKDKAVYFHIKEGEKVYISNIRFSGNKAFSDSELKKQISTQEEGWLSWMTEDNLLDRAKLDQDREKLNDFYYNHGYLNARVGAPEIKRGPKGLIVTFPIVEGPRYKVSSVGLTGDMIIPKAKLVPKLQTKPGEWFNRSKVRGDLMMLHDLYADKGYAYVQVRPRIRQDRKARTVAIGFDVKKGRKVWFENIVITGNTRTRDNVIRRELGVVEGSLFSSKALRRSNMRLRRLNFFEDVHISTSRGSAPDRMELKVHVKEKRTGNFSIGAGYSTVDNVMLMGTLAENNLFGRGQRLELRGSVGGKSSRYTLSFTEPWLFDKPVSAGFDIYDWRREYTNYDKEAIGGRLRFGFPTPLRYTRTYLYYKYEVAEVTGVDDNAALVIQDQRGEHTTSSLKTIVRRDSRNHTWNPTSGSDNSISVEYAGGILGGTNAFIKAIADSGWYIPIWWKHVLVLHGRLGWIGKHSGGTVPIYEKFFLGGINTLRGFDYFSVGPKDSATGDVIGGERMALFNFEYRFPLWEKAGLMGVAFFDTGNAWRESDGYDISDMRKSVGGGIRWYSPMGPLRLEYGYVLDPQPGEATSNWEFTVGSMF